MQCTIAPFSSHLITRPVNKINKKELPRKFCQRDESKLLVSLFPFRDFEQTKNNSERRRIKEENV